MDTTQHWQLALDEGTGALARLAHPADAHGMNWVCAQAENAWFPRSYGWGLGHLAMPGYPAAPRWETPVTLDGLTARYRLGALAITVTRTPRGEWLDEAYCFENTGATDLPIWGIGLCTPFNDNYPDAPTCVTQRCNAHLWCGGHVAYACALRMGGVGPHLGWVLTAGNIGGYSIQGRGLLTAGSNTRGIIVMNAAGATLKPGESLRLAATLFWHDGWDDFLTKARTLPGFVEVSAEHYTLVGAAIPAHEVNYEQSIIGPATLIPLEAYLLTRDAKYLRGAEAFLPLLDAFNGRQPDHHLHDIAIRHWDGFWFGRLKLWGDTFPHYWSALTG
jgi:hypothetical protein